MVKATMPGEVMQRRTRGYTLIELLAVMVIMGIIVAIALAAYTGITRGTSARKAAENVETALSLARQYASARNMPVIFLVLDSGFDTRPLNSSIPGIANIGPTRARHYAIYSVAGEKYLTGWTELPKGVVFDNTYVSGGLEGRNILAGDPQDLIYDRSGPAVEAVVPFPGSSDTNKMVVMPGIIFRSGGTLYFRDSGGTAETPVYKRICVAEGSYSGGILTIRPGGIKYGVRTSPLGQSFVDVRLTP
jgi:prepilin-type N-terminal cleavage/methylation domain-containing protein